MWHDFAIKDKNVEKQSLANNKMRGSESGIPESRDK